ncbi:MAG TPA: adenine phosphoribosyltransferase [Planctomycetaceae bacterium]|jgi:adenine phosphoribosyltransferase|nr:adenine phosphoribosyltransferase [Planctomycetaceae bacterium]
MKAALDLKQYIRSIPDFPKPGVLFRDITPLLAAPEAFQYAIDALADHYRNANVHSVLAAEARGFIFAAPLALALQARFIPIRKPGKLPFEKLSFRYELEYGTDALEMHTDAITRGERVLMIDDLLATGGTMEACLRIVEQVGGIVVGAGFIIELDFLAGRDRLAPCEVFSLLHYGSEAGN